MDRSHPMAAATLAFEPVGDRWHHAAGDPAVMPL
jgi:hypothetical protein